MRLTARDASGDAARVDRIVLPVSDEMDCRACHASGSRRDARPAAAGSTTRTPARLPPQHPPPPRRAAASSPAYAPALAAAGYYPAGLYATVDRAGTAGPLRALPRLRGAARERPGRDPAADAGRPLAPRGRHRPDERPEPRLDREPLGLLPLPSRLGDAVPARRDGERDGGRRLDADAVPELPRLHGGRRRGDAHRLARRADLPECHTGTATTTPARSATRASSTRRAPAGRRRPHLRDERRHAAAGLSLYRFSNGHGGLQCEACHGSTHAEYPSSHVNDNLQASTCRGTPARSSSAPPATAAPADDHRRAARAAPGRASWVTATATRREARTGLLPGLPRADDRGTVLSRTFAARSLDVAGRNDVRGRDPRLLQLPQRTGRRRGPSGRRDAQDADAPQRRRRRDLARADRRAHEDSDPGHDLDAD